VVNLSVLMGDDDTYLRLFVNHHAKLRGYITLYPAGLMFRRRKKTIFLKLQDIPDNSIYLHREDIFIII